MSALARLIKPDQTRSAGPAATFGSPHVLAILLSIGEVGSVGRGSLARQAGLGDGAIRTVIKHLKEEGYIKVEPTGCSLTQRGGEAYGELKGRLPSSVDLHGSPLTLGDEQVALLVKGRAGRVGTGIEQRDASIKAGAAGATSYTYRGSRFQMPGSSRDCEKDFPSEAWAELRRSLRPADGDVVIVCGSDDRRTSYIAAISSALTLLS